MSDSRPEDTDEFAPLHTPVMVTIAAFMVMGAGLFTAAAGGQLLTVVTVYTLWAKAVPWLLMFFGMASMVVGGVMSRAQFWAALAAVPLTAMMTLLAFVWTVWALLAGFFSLLPLVSGFLSLAALIVTPFAIPGAKRITEARAALFA